MPVGAIGVIGRLGTKAAMGSVKLGVKGVKATPGAIKNAAKNAATSSKKAAIDGAKASPGVLGRAAINIPTNIAKTFWNGYANDLGLSGLTIKAGPLLKSKPKADLDENGVPKPKRKKRKRAPDANTDIETKSDKITQRAATQIVAALKPLSAIETAIDGMDGSLSGLREDIQGLRSSNVRGFSNIVNTLKALLPNAFDNLRNKREHHDDAGKSTVKGKEGKGLLDSLGGLPSLINSIFGKAGLVATALGALGKIGRGVGQGVSAVGRGVARTGRGLVNAGRETIRGRSNSARTTARVIGVGEVIPEVVRPVEAPRVSVSEPVIENARPIPSNENSRATLGITEEGKANALKSLPPEQVAPRINANETVKPVEAPRAIDVNRPLYDAPRPGDKFTVTRPIEPHVVDPLTESERYFDKLNEIDPPKPAPKPTEVKATVAEVLKATETPTIGANGNAPEVKASETAIKPIEPEAPKPTLKPDVEVKATEGSIKPKTGIRGSSALSKALGRAFIGGAVILEGIQGYDEWSDAYDKYLAGEITPKEYRKKTIEIVGHAAGSLGGGLTLGAITGAGAGLMAGPGAPIASTVLGIGGGIVGGIAGSMFGGAVGSGVGNKVADALIGPIDDEDKKLTPRANGTTPQSSAIPEAPTIGVPTASTVEPPKEVNATGSVTSVQANKPSVAAANQMITNSNTVADKNRAGQVPIVIAPNNTTNTTNNSTSGGGGSGRPAVGNPRADLSPLDQANLGSRIGNTPGQNW